MQRVSTLIQESPGLAGRVALGLGFTPSPDRKYVAHVGPIVHFAAPIDQSYYLYIDKTVVYQLPKGMLLKKNQKSFAEGARRGSASMSSCPSSPGPRF